MMKAVISEVKLQSNHGYLEEKIVFQLPYFINLIAHTRKRVNYKHEFCFFSVRIKQIEIDFKGTKACA